MISGYSLDTVNVTAIDASTGKALWTKNSVDGGDMFGISQNGEYISAISYNLPLTALDPSTGAVLYTVTSPIIKSILSAFGVGNDGTSYILTTDYKNKQTLFAYNQTGQIWNSTIQYYLSGNLYGNIFVTENFIGLSSTIYPTFFGQYGLDGKFLGFIQTWGIFNKNTTAYYYSKYNYLEGGELSQQYRPTKSWSYTYTLPTSCRVGYSKSTISSTLSDDESILYGTMTGIYGCIDIAAVTFVDTKTGTKTFELSLPEATASTSILWSFFSTVKPFVIVATMDVSLGTPSTLMAFSYTNKL